MRRFLHAVTGGAAFLLAVLTGVSPTSSFTNGHIVYSDTTWGSVGDSGTPVSAIFPTLSVNNFGANPTGTSDSTTAFLDCLTATSALGGKCMAPQSGKYRILSNLTLPANSVLSCGHEIPGTPG